MPRVLQNLFSENANLRLVLHYKYPGHRDLSPRFGVAYNQPAPLEKAASGRFMAAGMQGASSADDLPRVARGMSPMGRSLQSRKSPVRPRRDLLNPRRTFDSASARQPGS